MTVEFFVARSLHYTQARQHERLPADFPVQLSTDQPRAQARAADLSETGVRLRLSRPLPVMTLVKLELTLPQHDEPVTLLGRVMWSAGRTMGVRFEQLDRRVTVAVARLRAALRRR